MLCCCSAAQACPTLCDPMDCSMSGIPVLLEFVQVHVYCISDAIQPSHPLTPSSPPALNLSQHQGLFQWVICSHQMTKILEPQTKYWCFSISPSSEYSGLISLKTDWFDLLAVQGTFRTLEIRITYLKSNILESLGDERKISSQYVPTQRKPPCTDTQFTNVWR